MITDSEVRSDPILECECDEPEGKVIRYVRKMNLEPERLKRFWSLSRKYPTLFSQEVRDSFPKFVNVFISQGATGLEANGLLWEIDDLLGVFYLNDIIPGVDANTHYTFLDGRFKGRIELTKKMLRYVFEKYKFRRLSTVIPKYAQVYADTFALNLGFKKEGRRRKCVLYNGEWFDATLYGILAEEVIPNGDGH